MNSVAIDAGAHVGFWSVAMIQAFQKVIAFEPRAENFACLTKNIQQTDRIIAIRAALGEKSGLCKVQGNIRQDPRNSGAYHVIPTEDGDIPVMPLDYIQTGLPVSLIKLDVEGFEAEVIRGGVNTIKTNCPAIIMERSVTASQNYGKSDSEAEELIQSMGYKLKAQGGRDFLYGV